jgi:hypothetical protein
MRPEPVVFLRLAFSPQLSELNMLAKMPSCRVPFPSREYVRGELGENVHCRILAAGYPHEEQVCFWMWRDRRPEG